MRQSCPSEAGLEMDWAVGLAIGWCGGDEGIPRFSVDLNAAFAAAERVGLFGNGCLLGHREGYWRIWDDEMDGAVSSGTTPALAICAAILKGKELEGVIKSREADRTTASS